MLSTQEQREILGKKIEDLRKAKGMTQEELAKKALEVIEDQKRFTKNLESEYIFCGYDGEPAHQNTIYRAWVKLSKIIGAEGTSLYSFRHTFVSLYGGSLPLPYLRTILGHSVNKNLH